MSELKATPGPWSYRNGETITIRDLDDNQLAILTFIKTKRGGRRDGDEVAASAKVMAASRELYDALHGLLTAVEGTFCEGSGSAQDEARQALAKARGEQP